MTEKKSKNKEQTLPAKSQFLLYQTEDRQTKIGVRLQDETIWMTQAAMAELYQPTLQNITIHLKAIFKDMKLEGLATCKEYLQVQPEDCCEVARTGKTLPFHQPVFKSIMSYFGIIFKIHFLKDPASIRTDGFFAQI
jgi:hypothetical protein